MSPDDKFSSSQDFYPVATDQALIVGGNEYITWYEPDLSGVKVQVAKGEDTSIRYIDATDDRLYAIAKSDDETGEEIHYTAAMDLATGELLEKVQLDMPAFAISYRQVYNNKYHFATLNADKQRTYHVFSSDVNKPFPFE